MGTGVFPQVTRNSLKLFQGRFRLDIRKYFFTKRAVRHWSRPLRKAMQLPSLEAFKSHVDVSLRHR